MAELLGEWTFNGIARYTAENKGRPYSPRNYTIKKYKVKTQITYIGFYDTVSMSYRFGFKIRRYKHKWVLFFGRYKTPISVDEYKDIIRGLKVEIFSKLTKR